MILFPKLVPPQESLPGNSLPPGRDNDHERAGHHRLTNSEADDELRDDLADQPRFVTVGLRLAAHTGFGTIDIPMTFIPVHISEVARG